MLKGTSVNLDDTISCSLNIVYIQIQKQTATARKDSFDTMDAQDSAAFCGRILSDLCGGMGLMLVYIGHKLNIWKTVPFQCS